MWDKVHGRLEWAQGVSTDQASHCVAGELLVHIVVRCAERVQPGSVAKPEDQATAPVVPESQASGHENRLALRNIRIDPRLVLRFQRFTRASDEGENLLGRHEVIVRAAVSREARPLGSSVERSASG